MSPRLAHRLNLERHRKLVGRSGERDLFRGAVSAEVLPFNVLHVFGPGGVGKTTLLREFAYLSEQAGIRASYVDGRDIEPSPASFMKALPDLDGSSRQVVLVDTYESLSALDGWIFSDFLPRSPDDLLLVLAGCNPPAEEWRVDPGWRTIVRLLPLRNLSEDESLEYLFRQGVPQGEHRSILDFTHGHPLALSLVADVFARKRDGRFRPEETPDVIKALLEHFVHQVPGPAHRAALESCALVRHTTEALLSRMVAIPEVHELFEWLRDLTFVESGPFGLFPHDVAREALAADLHWRNPDWYAELHGRARSYYADRLKKTHGTQQQRILFDYMFLHRDNPVIRPFLEWRETGAASPELMREGDAPALEAMVAEHEGPESARLAAHWFKRQPESVATYRNVEGRPAGFITKVALRETSADDRERDPAVEAARRYLEENAPLRPGERATLFRFWMARDTYQAVSATQSLIFANVAQHYLNTPRLAFTFLPVADPEFWIPAFTYCDLKRLSGADFEVGGRRYGIYAHDWRTMPPAAWLDLLAEREVSPEPLAAAVAEPLVVLGEEEFASAVRDALKNYCRPDALLANPLIRSRLIARRAGEEDGRVEALKKVLAEAAGSLQESPREVKLYRAIHRTFLSPAPSQERAAELLDLPFSTYRRHLKGGIERVAGTLWRQEIHNH